ncbi:cytochrome c oxidase cbb3-type subunit 3 [Gelidibacter algens]|uniref:Cytochrome c oxidase cbb3-type subunit 3 n=1 Tax=Gelidibacter algens TaxID=49280 RepID=A0A1A7R4C3_9FLAO|nr:cbb3-type cytochrome c oxidase N-terminal domain-containing protein [Gelidibacter algens]OBX25612.1 cytochrome C oxidase subunit III [Gelidibacter algens]RAJ27843.1 cytochrome c oxidase cbb3-type subunit 3 [Gelidibacter algens]
MRNLIPSYVRVPLIFLIIFGLIEFFVDAGNEPAFMKYPVIMLFLLLVVLVLLAIEAIVGALENVMFQSLDEAAQARFLATKKSPLRIVEWVKNTYKKMLGSKPMEKEGEIVLDHNYDGIKELDNDLPPWWLYGFYASIIFAFVYMLRYHVFDGENQYDELQTTLAQAKVELEEYKKTAKDMVDFNSVIVLTDAADLSNGKTIYEANCVACHMADGGGGIGPNLTDKNWILGGGIKNIFNTISEGGRNGKGMIAWKQTLKPNEMAQVSSYVMTFEGTTPAKPKDPEGEIWTSENAPKDAIPTEAIENKTDDVISVEK